MKMTIQERFSICCQVPANYSRLVKVCAVQTNGNGIFCIFANDPKPMIEAGFILGDWKYTDKNGIEKNRSGWSK